MRPIRFILLALGILYPGVTQAAISVGPTGTGISTFDTQPAATEWATASIAGAPADFTDAATLDDAVMQLSAADINATLGTSGTVPPSANAIARRNTNQRYLQTRPTASAYLALMATLQNDTGGPVRYLNISYTFGLALANGSSAAEEVRAHRAFYSLTGEPGSWKAIPAFTEAVPGELTETLDLGTWAAGATLYLLWADDDSAAGTTAPNEEGAYTIDNFQATALSGREPILGLFSGNGAGFEAQITEGDAPRTVNQSTLAVTLNGASVTPVILKAGDTVYASFSGAPLPVGSTNTVVFNFSDNNTPAKAYSITRTFVVAPYVVIPASFAVAGVNTSLPGFKARVHQISAARGPGDANSVENAERQLADQIINPDTGLPYENEADLSLAVNGLFDVEGVINWNQDAPTEAGNFSALSDPPMPDESVPGIPGINFSTDNFAVEILTFLELKAGAYRMGVNSDDGFKVTAGPNPRDALSLVLGSYSGGRAAGNTVFDFVVEADGIYPFRLAWWEGGSDASVEWFMVDENGKRTLINDRTQTDAVKAYRQGPAGPIFVQSISPFPGSTNAAGDLVLTVVLTDAATQVQPSSVQLFVNGQQVNATVSKPAGSASTTITYDPPGVLEPETELAVRLVYGDNATPSVVRTNSYTVKVRPLVLVDINDTQIWRYSNEGLDLGTEWREKNYNDSAWPEGPALLAAESGATAEPVRTQLVRSSPDGTQIITDYFRTRFTFSGNPAAVQLILEHVVDDGAVFYLNGTEIHRFGTGAATVVNSTTTFSGHENAYAGPFIVPAGSLVNGENVLAAEVHQESAGSSDSVLGAVLMASILTDIPPSSVQSVSPASGAVNVSSNAVIEFNLADGSRTVVTNSIQLTINGEAVTPVISKPAGGILTSVSYAPAGGFTPEALIDAKLTFSDSAGNVTSTNTSFRVQTSSAPIFGIDDNQIWRYSNEGLDLGTEWKEKAYDDSAWAEGPALLAAETGSTAEPIRTPLVRTTPDGSNIVTDYFRTRFNFTGDPAATRLQIRHVVDDGVVVYLNGVEVHRFGLAAGAPFDSRTFFNGHENSYAGPFEISTGSLVQGENIIAAEVHQSDLTSSDMVFGLELQRITSTRQDPPTQPNITRVARAGGDIQIEWTGGGRLQSADAVNGAWTDVANATSPYSAPISGNARFFRIQQ